MMRLVMRRHSVTTIGKGAEVSRRTAGSFVEFTQRVGYSLLAVGRMACGCYVFEIFSVRLSLS